MKVKCFGIVKEIVNQEILEIDGNVKISTVQELRTFLSKQFPEMSNINLCMVAVNQSYADDHTVISSKDEIAIIPPVAGG